MPPAAKKDVSVILFDVNTKSHQKAIQTLMKICCTKYFDSSKDLTKLILFNSDVTENRLAAQHGGYSHINEICKDVIRYNPQLILEMVENSGTGEASFLEAVHVGLVNFQEEFEQFAGVITYQLLVITDLNSPGEYNEKIFNKIVRRVNEFNVFVYVVGPEIGVPFTIRSDDDIKKWMKGLTVDENDPNLQSAIKLVTQTENSVICNFEMGWQLFLSYHNWPGGQPWNVPLSVGTDIQLAAKTLKIFDTVTNLKLTSDRFGDMKWIDAEDESVEIDRQDVIQGITRHEKFVQMPDNNMFKLQTTRSFNVLCFTDSSNIPEYMMGGEGCYCVLPAAEKNEAFNILIDTLAEQQKYVVARRVYNNNYAPKIVLLVPKPNHKPKCFYLTSLPFADEVRVYLKEKNPKSAVESDIPKEVFQFLNGLDVDREDREKSIPLGINMIQNVSVQKIVNKAADKFLERNMNLADIDMDYLASAENVKVEDLKTIWPERSLEEVKKEENAGSDSEEEFDWS